MNYFLCCKVTKIPAIYTILIYDVFTQYVSLVFA